MLSNKIRDGGTPVELDRRRQSVWIGTCLTQHSRSAQPLNRVVLIHRHDARNRPAMERDGDFIAGFRELFDQLAGAIVQFAEPHGEGACV